MKKDLLGLKSVSELYPQMDYSGILQKLGSWPVIFVGQSVGCILHSPQQTLIINGISGSGHFSILVSVG